MRFGNLILQSLSIGAAAWTETQQCALTSLFGEEAKIIRELGLLLSEKANVISTSSPAAALLLGRGSGPRISPAFSAIVEVATEGDVQETVNYANRHKMPFLAVSGAHGWPTTLNGVRNGIQINMRKMNRTRLNPSGKTATVEGGTLQHEAVAALFKQGRSAVTGICECVSIVGPLLGGGHSFLQARHGFASDNLVSARIVLANGSAIDVSAEKNADLFWALGGAGHNFGIITSLEIKTFDARPRWAMAVLTFTYDKLESFFETWNRQLDKHEDPGMLVVLAIAARNATLDTKRPVLNLQLLWEGDETAVDDYLAAFRQLKPASDLTVLNIPWGNLHKVGGYGIDTWVCDRDRNMIGFPNSFARWDTVAMRKGLDMFSEITADQVFASSVFLLETYGNKGVRAVPEDYNAVAPEERRHDILISHTFLWDGDDPLNVRKVVTYGEKIQKVVRGASPPSPPHSYLNYANGGEQLIDVYGHDEARLAKLRRLKHMYDPHNRFGFYMPIQ
ncbi:hypothetical protein HIM_01380 [Hirsutella minnesotensis 3608]|nr:hypothetical protein HIM_01380 [Hirsutella minnesotensis 3608]